MQLIAHETTALVRSTDYDSRQFITLSILLYNVQHDWCDAARRADSSAPAKTRYTMLLRFVVQLLTELIRDWNNSHYSHNSALKVDNFMRYINLLTYLLTTAGWQQITDLSLLLQLAGRISATNTHPFRRSTTRHRTAPVFHAFDFKDQLGSWQPSLEVVPTDF